MLAPSAMHLLLNAYCTHRDPPPLDFAHRLMNRRGRGEELAEHLHGFIGFVMGGGARPMNQSRFHVLGHIERVRHHLSLEVEREHMPAFEAWAKKANAIVFTTDSAVRAPNGAILVDPESGDAAPGALVPYLPDAVERKARTERLLTDVGLPFLPALPPVVSEAEVELRDTTEIARRCLALFACALRAESLAANEPIPPADLEARLPLAFGALSPNERAFMSDPAPARQEIVNHGWRYEAVAVLAWAVGAVESLPFPKSISDVPALAQTMFDVVKGPFTPKPVGVAAVLDTLDLHYRLHWAVQETRRVGRSPSDSVEPGVVLERHHALNWLTRFQDADWDDVDTPT